MSPGWGVAVGLPEQVALAGGEDVLGRARERSREIEFAELRRADPDFIVLMPCGFGVERATAEAELLLSRDDWAALAAARAGRIYAVDGASHFSRPGPRLIEGVEVLASVLQSDRVAAAPAASVRQVASYTPRAN